tara:strand:+ start:5468 stop:9811 length:4344 start_codon:yes stop_codon:yes gene_type:complete
MGDLFDIGKAGITAYKKSLAATGQNIANVGTEGYARREASVVEVSLANADILSISNTSGLGVRVAGITRSFDQFLDLQLQHASSSFSFTKSKGEVLERLESVLLPQSATVGTRIQDFFEKLNNVALDPSDLNSRKLALTSANSLSREFASLHNGLSDLKKLTQDTLELTALEFNSTLKNLSQVQTEILGHANKSGAPNILLDKRDSLLETLSELSDISVEYASNGGLSVSLGRLGNMGTLLDGTSHNKLSLDTRDGETRAFLQHSNGNQTAATFSSGQMAGLISAESLLSVTTTELNSLAQKFVQEMNLAHRSGVDLNGDRGTDLFSLEGATLNRISGNTGNTTIRIEGFSKSLVGATLEVKFDANKNIWNVTGGGDVSIPDFKSRLEIDGLTIEVQGPPKHGDTFNLDLSDTQASNMRALIVGSEKLAVAGLHRVEPSTTNSGNSELEIGYAPEIANGDAGSLNELFSEQRNAANPIRFNSSGILGLAENVGSIEDLSFLKSQTSLRIFTDLAQLSAADNLTLQVGGTNFQFDLTSVFSELNSANDLAEILNSGALVSNASNKSFNDLGLQAVASGTSFVIASAFQQADANFSALTAGSLGGVAGILATQDASNADMAVFTKEGVQISGKLLSGAEAAQIITEENGFSREAVYRADFLPTISDAGYLGATVSRKTTDGLDVASLTAAGLLGGGSNNLSVYGAAAFPAQRVQLSQPMTVTMATGQSQIVNFENGMMAGQIAEKLSSSLKPVGVGASAVNLVELTGLSGLVEFELFGHNLQGSSVSTNVTSTSIAALVSQINSFSTTTGINAYLSGETGVILEQVDAGDVVLKNANLSSAAGIKVNQLDHFGERLWSTSQTLSSGEHLVAGGAVQLRSPTDFTVNYGGQNTSSGNSSFESGFVDKVFNVNKNYTDMSFYTNHLVDSDYSNAHQIDVVASASKYSLTLSDPVSGQLVSEFSPQKTDDFSSLEISKALASNLRGQAVSTIFKGDSFNLSGGFPSDGSKINFNLGEQKYTVTLNLGDPVEVRGTDVVIGGDVFSMSDGLKELVARSKFSISGPESDRLLAEFTATGTGFQFSVSVNSGILSGDGLVLASDNSNVEKAQFHISSTSKTEMYSKYFANASVTDTDIGTVMVGTAEYGLCFHAGAPSRVDVTAPGTMPAWMSFVTEANPSDATQIRIKVSIDHDVTRDKNIRIKSNGDSQNYGIFSMEAQLMVTDGGLRVSNIGDQRITSAVSVNSLASEILSVDGLNGEDLIFASIGARNPQAIGGMVSRVDSPLREYEFVVNKTDTNTVDIFDNTSGHILGSRSIANDNSTTFQGLSLDFKGSVAGGDQFRVLLAEGHMDDASNLKKMMDLSFKDKETGVGGYSELFGTLVSNTGSEIQANQQALEASEAAYKVARNSKEEFSGVNLDTEAARLMEQQQAYQALARVLTTAQELLDTLLKSM